MTECAVYVGLVILCGTYGTRDKRERGRRKRRPLLFLFFPIRGKGKETLLYTSSSFFLPPPSSVFLLLPSPFFGWQTRMWEKECSRWWSSSWALFYFFSWHDLIRQEKGSGGGIKRKNRRKIWTLYSINFSRFFHQSSKTTIVINVCECGTIVGQIWKRDGEMEKRKKRGFNFSTSPSSHTKESTPPFQV